MRSFGRLHRAYQVTAIVLLNTCVLFVLVNIALFLFLEIHSKLAGQSNPIADKYGQAWLKARYPDMTENDVKGLLKETWSLHFKYEPYTQFRERPYSGRWVTVDPHGFRVSRNQGPWPPSPDYFNVFVFGGSTTFSYGVSNDQTIASYLQLGPAFRRDPESTTGAAGSISLLKNAFYTRNFSRQAMSRTWSSSLTA